MTDVYCGFECSYNFCETFEQITIIFSDEEKAIEWVSDFTPVVSCGSTTEWREYRKYEVM